MRGNLVLEDKDAAKHPIVWYSPTETKNHPAQNVNRAKAETVLKCVVFIWLLSR